MLAACSTDEIYAEKKYKDPFSYVPTHTLVLYTNHLPKVGAIDKGTWRRLIVIPFGAKIEGSSDIKNYADYLFEKAGGAILSWVIEGAKKVIADDFHIAVPKKVQKAIDAYKENNDWMSAFLNERCELVILQWSNQENFTTSTVHSAYRWVSMFAVPQISIPQLNPLALKDSETKTADLSKV